MSKPSRQQAQVAAGRLATAARTLDYTLANPVYFRDDVEACLDLIADMSKVVREYNQKQED